MLASMRLIMNENMIPSNIKLVAEVLIICTEQFTIINELLTAVVNLNFVWCIIALLIFDGKTYITYL